MSSTRTQAIELHFAVTDQHSCSEVPFAMLQVFPIFHWEYLPTILMLVSCII